MEPKQRHGCLSAWLIMMIIGNALSTIVYFIVDPKIFEPEGIILTKTQMLLFGCLGLINLVFAIGLWYWKKWAFIGFAISGFLMFLTNINLGSDFTSSSLGLIGVLILYSILQMKKEDISGWEQLD